MQSAAPGPAGQAGTPRHPRLVSAFGAAGQSRSSGRRQDGVPGPWRRPVAVPSDSVAEGSAAAKGPAPFAAAVGTLRRAVVRPEVRVEEMRPPQRLAPWTYALELRVVANATELATGRLVLLYDPAGHEVWDGTLRLVGYATVEVDAEMAGDPLLPDVGWSWLLDALDEHGASHTAAGGTVTQTTSRRFGDLSGPQTTAELELRVSWTPVASPAQPAAGAPPDRDAPYPDLCPHLAAWADLLCTAAGLPPPGVAVLPARALRDANG